jgi:hypothetical protein
MDDNIKKLIDGIIEVNETVDYQFQRVCGFTFAFKKKELFINGQIASSEIRPVAIIYEENGLYYLAPIDVVDEIEEVVKQFVEKTLQ